MKTVISNVGDLLTRYGERHNIRFLIYNPIIWARFLTSSRRGGRILSQVIIDMYPDVKTCIDVGSGAGGYVYWFNRRGLEAIGVEYSPTGRFLARLQGARTLPFDCGNPAMRPPLGPVDLAFSVEVAEHIPQCLEDNFIDYATSHSNFVIFSAAQPNQPGQGHINCQPLDHWRHKFEQRGFSYCDSETSHLSSRLLHLGFKGCLPRNCQVFRRPI